LPRETRCTDAPAVERSKTALPRCDVHAGHLLRACRSTAATWRVLGAHVAGFHPNTPTPETVPKLPPAALEGTSSALQPPPCGYVWSSGAPEHGNGTSSHPPVVGAHVDGPGWLDLHARGVGRVVRLDGCLVCAGHAETACVGVEGGWSWAGEASMGDQRKKEALNMKQQTRTILQQHSLFVVAFRSC